MTRYKVIGGLNGAYSPSYDSGVVDTKQKARNILNDKAQEFREMQDHSIDRKTAEFFTVSRPSETQIDYKYEIVEVD